MLSRRPLAQLVVSKSPARRAAQGAQNKLLSKCLAAQRHLGISPKMIIPRWSALMAWQRRPIFPPPRHHSSIPDMDELCA